MSNTTPAPWSANGSRIEAPAIDYATLARTYGPGSHANAKLISAAPELLAALIGLEDLAGRRCLDLQSPEMLAARRAINKAMTGLSL